MAQDQASVKTILITGTNGKTTVTHILKHLFRQAGVPLFSNIHWDDDREERAEAFFEKIQTMRARKRPALFVLEVDEGDFHYFTKEIKPDWVMIGNLSRNQLDRYGELTGLAKSLEDSLLEIPECEVILCADDPLVAAIGLMADGERPKKKAFFYGLEHQDEDDRKASSEEHYFIESPHCAFCGTLLRYKGLAFSNFGNFFCPACKFKRPTLDLTVCHLGGEVREELYSMRFQGPDGEEEVKLRLQLPALLNAYNAAAAALLAHRVGLSVGQIRLGLERCLPPRGRFERFLYRGQELCFLRGENPEALNANLAWALSQEDYGGLILSLDAPGQKHAGDLSWLWDVLFEKLPFGKTLGVTGERAYDLALRLNYAGVKNERLLLAHPKAEGVNPNWPESQQEDKLLPPEGIGKACDLHLGNRLTQEAILFRRLLKGLKGKTLYWLTDKAAAHRLRPELAFLATSEIDVLQQAVEHPDHYGGVLDLKALSSAFGFKRELGNSNFVPRRPEAALSKDDRMGIEGLFERQESLPYSLRLAYLYPDELNLYGDRGNVLCLTKRAESCGITLEVDCLSPGDPFDPKRYDLVFMGGGQDKDQDAVYPDFVSKADQILEAVESGVVFLCICGGYQLMGKTYLTAEGRRIEGLGLLDLETQALGKRMVGDLIFECDEPGLKGRDRLLLGFENHGGETFLGPGARPLGKVLQGFGNNSEDAAEGCVYKNLYGTYAHGAFLPRNPKMADRLLALAFKRKYPKLPFPSPNADLDDELATLCREARFKEYCL